MKSIIQTNKQCFLCGSQNELHEHHIFYGTANRKWSEEYGLKVWLCPQHHNMSAAGVHFNRDFDMALKALAQAVFEKVVGTHEEFMRIFGKNWI